MPYDKQLNAFSHPVRQHILTNLALRPMSVRELTDAANVSQPVMSQHLKVLKEVGLVTATSVGASNIYGLEGKKLEELRAYWTAHWTNLLASLNHSKD
ncbi:MAG: metalloregulator ArsR/SmtB family transcription factor [Sulfitobacter sp.]